MARLDEILRSHVAQGEDTTDKLLGATFTVLDKNGTVIYQGSFGRTDFPLNSAPYTPETPTIMMSITKLITAACLLQVVEKGLVTLDEDVRTHLPELATLQILKGFDESDKPILEDNTQPITLRQLLTHTSGLAYDLAEPSLIKWSTLTSRTSNALTWNLAGFTCPLIYPPGHGWRYGTGIDWAGQLLERVTGQKLSAYMDEHIFQPLQMRSTAFWPHARADLKDRLAVTAFRPKNPDGGGEALVPIPNPAPVEHDIESGGAGLYGTAADYAKFVAALVRGDEAVFARAETREEFFCGQLTAEQKVAMAEVVGGMRDALAPDIPEGIASDFAFAGMVNLEDIPGRRRRGSVMWSGMANAHWWIDRETGVAGVLYTTVFRDPPGDPVVIRLYRELEEEVYGGLLKR